MPRVREVLLLTHHFKFLSHEKFVLLYGLNKPKNPERPRRKKRFDIDDLCDDECQTNFRFLRNDFYRLTEVLDFPDEIDCFNGLVVDKVEALPMFLKRFSYPCHYADMVPLFSRPIPQICMITNNVMNFIYDGWRHLLFDLNQPGLPRANLERLAAAIKLENWKTGKLENWKTAGLLWMEQSGPSHVGGNNQKFNNFKLTAVPDSSNAWKEHVVQLRDR
ncbi:hypothetical protein AWC38_SpisGene20065 [Stylophora pistillata]|uniref:Uncharacterized protein n=1 Tax=Stylophora pistillata TaxID=50429 RepID=A0A2B4RFX7_STYPI|nr:hypothetical protein AWC38_SpisGene20065 [Stylophora pistillata]